MEIFAFEDGLGQSEVETGIVALATPAMEAKVTTVKEVLVSWRWRALAVRALIAASTIKVHNLWYSAYFKWYVRWKKFGRIERYGANLSWSVSRSTGMGVSWG